jgi:hydroxyacylglutathione hydrolase
MLVLMAVDVYPLLARGVFATFGYFVIDGEMGRGVLVDPGAQPGLFLSAARERGWKIDAILLTHGHFDHMGAAGELRDAWSAPVRAHELADRYLLDPRLNLSAEHGAPITLAGASKLSDGDCIPVGGIAGALEVLHVPGHTDDSCAFWCEQGGFALVGDAVYEGGPGLTVFPTGDGCRRAIRSAPNMHRELSNASIGN